MLHLTGYDLSLDDLRAFRQWGSKTPGHPERNHTDGVEVTTGPLGQGLGNAVGMAIAERQLRARVGADLVDHRTFCVVGDGDLSEGLSHEAASLAGHLGLGRLVCVYDDNHISIDGPTELSLSDDAAARFTSYGWHVEHLGEAAEDLDALEAALRAGQRRGAPPVARHRAQPHRVPVAIQDRRPGHPRLRAEGRRDQRGQGRHGPARRGVLRARRRAGALPDRRRRAAATSARRGRSGSTPTTATTPRSPRSSGPPERPAGPTRCPRGPPATRRPPASPAGRSCKPSPTSSLPSWPAAPTSPRTPAPC